MDPADRVVVAAAAGEPDELDVRVAREQPDQLGADVPGRPDDADPDAPGTAGRIHAPPGAGEADRATRRDPRERLEARAHGRDSVADATRPLSGA